MGIYYYAKNNQTHEYIGCPLHFVKVPGIFSPESPFGRLLLFVMKYRWWNQDVVIVDDVGYELDNCKDITQEILDEWRDYSDPDTDMLQWFPTKIT